MSAVCSLISIGKISIILFFTNCLKWWYLRAIRLDLGENFCAAASEIQLLLSSKTLQWNFGFFRFKGNTSFISFSRFTKGMSSLVAWLRAVYSASVLDTAVYVCNLIQNRTGQLVYMSTYPVLDGTTSAFPESALSQPQKSVSAYHSRLLLPSGLKSFLYHS